MELLDVIIVGGGPAGLNAAVVLGRCRRKVLLFDSQEYRNRFSHGMHNYLTRDDIEPLDFIKHCHRELEKYGVALLHRKITYGRLNEGSFLVKDDTGALYHSRKLLIATGVQDNIPDVEGMKELYGKSVFHCPYCDGWEVRDKKIGVYASNKEGWELALNIKTWSAQVTLYTDGKDSVKRKHKKYLDANEIPIVKEKIERLIHENDQLKQVQLKSGATRECDAMFFVNGFSQQCNLADVFDCNMSSKGVVVTNRYQQTNIAGLFVAGDASVDMHFVVVAAAEGAKAGVIINKELQKEAYEKERSK